MSPKRETQNKIRNEKREAGNKKRVTLGKPNLHVHVESVHGVVRFEFMKSKPNLHSPTCGASKDAISLEAAA